MGLRYYANAPATTLSVTTTNIATTITVTATTGFPISYPYTLILDRGLAAEEVVSVTGASGNVLTVTRGYDSTTAFAHSFGASVQHGFSAIDPREANSHVNASSGVHGLTGSVVGTTDTQTLTNKTLTAPKVDVIKDANGNSEITFTASGSAVNGVTVANASTGFGPVISATGSDTNINLKLASKGTGTVQANSVDVATVSGTQTLTNKTVNLSSNTVSGTTAQFNTALSDNDFATLAGSETLTNKTLSTGTIVGAGTDISGAWTSFTPTLGNISLGNGTLTGRYVQLGKIIKGHVEIVAGSTTTYSAGTLTVGGLPVAAASTYVLNGSPAGPAFMHNGSSATRNIGVAVFTSTTSIFFVYGSAAGATVTNTAPFTFGTASVLTVAFEYEAA